MKFKLVERFLYEGNENKFIKAILFKADLKNAEIPQFEGFHQSGQLLKIDDETGIFINVLSKNANASITYHGDIDKIIDNIGANNKVYIACDFLPNNTIDMYDIDQLKSNSVWRSYHKLISDAIEDFYL